MIYFESLIVGNGEVGSSLKKVLDKRQNKENSGIIDKKDKNFKRVFKELKCKTLHICYPYSNNFIKNSLKYVEHFQPELVINHSTVPVGTTKKIKDKILSSIYIVHSPVTGDHPYLVKSLMTFVKYVGTENKKAYLKTKKEMSNMSLKWFSNSKDTELGKLLSTSYYGIVISWHREMKNFCEYFNVSYKNAITDFNLTYNAGYKKFRPEVIRPVLYPPKNKIGGHCVIQNARLLNKQKKSKFLSIIK